MMKREQNNELNHTCLSKLEEFVRVFVCSMSQWLSCLCPEESLMAVGQDSESIHADALVVALDASRPRMKRKNV
jgi:hypothetical protein